MRTIPFITASLMGLFLIACNSGGDATAEAATATAQATAENQAGEAQGEKGHACADKGGAPCACGQNGENTHIEHAEITTRKTEDGKTVMHAGKPFAEVETVTVNDLLANPDAFSGKTVQVSGDVAAMCTHKRAWFSIAAGDQSGQQLRVIAAPTFLVPDGSIGKSAVAQGSVEVIEISADHAKHLAAEHKVGEGEKIAGPVKRVILRAAGAEFI